MLRFILYISVYLCYPRWEFWGVSVPFRNVEGSPARLPVYLLFFVWYGVRAANGSYLYFAMLRRNEHSRVSRAILNIITQPTTRKKICVDGPSDRSTLKFWFSSLPVSTAGFTSIASYTHRSFYDALIVCIYRLHISCFFARLSFRGVSSWIGSCKRKHAKFWVLLVSITGFTSQ